MAIDGSMQLREQIENVRFSYITILGNIIMIESSVKHTNCVSGDIPINTALLRQTYYFLLLKLHNKVGFFYEVVKKCVIKSPRTKTYINL